MTCPKKALCLIDPIWLDDHEYDARFGTCRRKCECSGCGEIRWSQPYPCAGKGDNDACMMAFEDARRLGPNS